ncbi:MAG TPA: isochorismatase family protein [Kofleriaceae bacterium]|nr:isochorismatase family protein [Kofleriaceae bacterium]
MPITTLDPATALVVIDLQRGIVANPLAHPADAIIAHAARLARAFRARGLPVVLVNVAGRAPGRTDARLPPFQPPADWTELVPELAPAPTDLRITKYTWGAFHGTPLDLQLRRRGVTQLVLCGISTSIGVETTARAAYEHGYHVTLAVDAMTDAVPELHHNTVERVFPRLGETGTTADVLARLGA